MCKYYTTLYKGLEHPSIYSWGSRTKPPVGSKGQLYKEYSRNLSVQRVKDTLRVKINIPLSCLPPKGGRCRISGSICKWGCPQARVGAILQGREDSPHVLSILTLFPLHHCALMCVSCIFMIWGFWAFHRERETCGCKNIVKDFTLG